MKVEINYQIASGLKVEYQINMKTEYQIVAKSNTK